MAQQPLAPDDAKIHPETHPLFQRLYGEEGFAPLSGADLDEFLTEPGLKMVVFAEDPNAKRVTMDIVVIAPELKKAFQGTLSDTRFADMQEARALGARWGLRRFPAVALFRDATFLGAVEALQPWETYCRMLAEIVQRKEAPARTIAIQTAVPTSSCSEE